MKTHIALVIACCASVACSHKMHKNTPAFKNQIPASYNTYNWLSFKQAKGGIEPNAANYTNEFFYYYNELTDKYIRDAVDAEMKLNSLQLSDNEALLQVRYHIVTAYSDSFNYTFSGKDTAMLHTINPNHPSAITGINEEKFPKGGLVIELVEIKSQKVAWRGWTTGAFDNSSKGSKKEVIQKAVKKIFADFPLKVTAKN